VSDTTTTAPSVGKGVSCFVIGPIGDKFAEHGTNEKRIYENSVRIMEEVVLPACAKFGIAPIRADSIAEPGEIPEQVFELLRDVDIVIADLSGGNPNVMYELGLRHTRNRCTISMAEIGRIPFDVTVIRTIKFRRTEAGLIDAREKLAASLSECLRGNHRPVTATRLWEGLGSPRGGDGIQPSSETVQDSATEDDDGDDDQQMLFLERLAELEDALPRLLESMQQITNVTEAIAALFTTAQAKIAEMDSRGQGGASSRLMVAKEVGRELTENAARLEAAANAWELELARADSGMSVMIEAVEADPSRLHELGDLPTSIEAAVSQMREAMENGDAMANIVASLASIARPLNKPSKRVATAIRRVSKASAIFQVWNSRMQRLVLEADTREEEDAGTW
jgi:hypothetical protein